MGGSRVPAAVSYAGLGGKSRGRGGRNPASPAANASGSAPTPTRARSSGAALAKGAEITTPRQISGQSQPMEVIAPYLKWGFFHYEIIKHHQELLFRLCSCFGCPSLSAPPPAPSQRAQPSALDAIHGFL